MGATNEEIIERIENDEKYELTIKDYPEWSVNPTDYRIEFENGDVYRIMKRFYQFIEDEF